MKKELKLNKNMIIMFLIICLLLAILLYISSKKNTSTTIVATITYVGNNYIIVEDENEEEYTLKIDKKYSIGDKVLFTIKDIKKNSNPKEGTVEKIDIISKNDDVSTDDSIPDKETEVEQNQEEKPYQPDEKKQEIKEEIKEEVVQENLKDSEQLNSSMTEENSEIGVVSYFETLNTNLDAYNQDKSLGESIKNGFVSVVDFLFYEGTIKGKTFNELSTTAKLKVLKLAFSIDKKIEQYFPGYKEQISSTSSKIYTNVKTKALELYLDITTKVCENNADTCSAAKEGLSDLKSSFSLTWDFIKDISGIGLSKLKAWYEVWQTT